MSAYIAGNRLPVPKSVKSAHFFYLTNPVLDCAAAVSTLATAIGDAVADKGINPLQILVLRPKDLADEAAATEAMATLLRRLGVCDDRELRSASLLCCEWASPHVDDSYSGEAFLSVVLHTGRHPYLMQSLHTEFPTGRDGRVETSTRRLEVGDVFVFDPTTAHLVAPVHPDASQLLCLMQISLKDQSEDDRAAILKRFAPRTNDKDHADTVFAGEDPS